MRVSLLQTDIKWEDKTANLRHVESFLQTLSGTTDLVILPEMFSTGFSMNSHLLAETVTEETISTLRTWASTYRLALAGSYIAKENGVFYNRGFFITPEREAIYYDKKHLFRMGEELNHFSAGADKVIISYLGWNIRLLICYDLRFPVWSRNIDNEYDLLIYPANWPSARQTVWDALLPARALENMSYVCGVNRVGTDGNGLTYTGGSVAYDAKGKQIIRATDNKEGAITATLDLASLQEFRKKFPAWKDADKFSFMP
ncbi:amidohydrolase [Bacteroides sp. 214]|uniref:amidohydrolase n=1 Tax=Bacteroides sp. 214 TaxID=2302935 RepID=UPI0013D8AEFD|nr:amidohydrolase [Bacteroides sp. 214]NDW11295.1 amidohydrolase [Bacteroides sp. 214]